MLISPYQHAVLQEMGIPVWITKEAYFAAQNDKKEDKKTSTTAVLDAVEIERGATQSKPSSQREKQARLDQLRAQVGGTPRAKESATLNQPRSTRSDASSPSQPLGIPLSADQKVTNAAWLDDLTLACVQLGLSSSQVNVLIGNNLSIHEDAIVLPAPPERLDTQQKRALWSALVATSKAKE